MCIRVRQDAAWRVRWDPLTDGEMVAAGDSVFAAVHTPGHSPDHLCFWHQDSRQLFCGDLAWKGSTVVIPPSQGGDVAAYLASLERILQLEPETMLPAHGPVTVSYTHLRAHETPEHLVCRL